MSITDRTSESGARSETDDCVRWSEGRGPTRGGLDERIPVLEVGTGVGYLRKALEVAWRFAGRGSPGDEERGSNAGSSEGAGLLTPAVEGSVGSSTALLAAAEGDESMLWLCFPLTP